MEKNELNTLPEQEIEQEIEQEMEDIEEQNSTGKKKRKKKKQKKTFWQEVREWIVSLISAVVIVLILQNFVFTLIRVDGGSMNDTLLDGERLFVSVADVKFGDAVERDAVVICHYPNRGRTFFVKRVVGVPGDTIYRQYGVTHVVYETVDENGETVIVDQPLDDQFISLFYNLNNDYEPYTLGEDEYFVVGDNRGNSHDSRDWNDDDPSRDVGPISKDMITGRVRYVIWPLNEIRPVE